MSEEAEKKWWALWMPPGSVRAVGWLATIGILGALAFWTQNEMVIGALISVCSSATQQYFGRKREEGNPNEA